MLIHLKGIIFSSYELFGKMSPYLLFGFFFAGVLHITVSVETITKHLGKNSIGSVIKAVIFGIPLPLCSCGVIPSAIAIKKAGASKGAVVSFLIATPITGVDSILATYSLLGLAFTIFRVIASCITAFIAGILTNLTHIADVKKEQKTDDKNTVNSSDSHVIPSKVEDIKHTCCNQSPKHNIENHVCKCHDNKNSLTIKIIELFRYAFVQLILDIWKWLLLGVLIGGLIEYFVPTSFIQNYLGNSWLAMLMMLVIGIPMYVCSTGSIPIAASLMMKGMSPGAGLVFLLAGPATNAITITIVSKELGKKATGLYVGTIAVMSISLGMLLNLIWSHIGFFAPKLLQPVAMLPKWIETSSAITLGLLIIIAILKSKFSTFFKK